jgi:hypothetical protein
MTLELKSLKAEPSALLEADGWTIEKLAVATTKELVAYRGIGRVGAAKIIGEAIEMLNEQGLDDADRLATEYYYQKSTLTKILLDWEEGGLSLEAVALASGRALAALKGIEESLAMRLISKAQDLINERALHQSWTIAAAGGIRQSNPAFDTRWLSGEVEPPPMSVRVRRNFEAAQREYQERR